MLRRPAGADPCCVGLSDGAKEKKKKLVCTDAIHVELRGEISRMRRVLGGQGTPRPARAAKTTANRNKRRWQRSPASDAFRWGDCATQRRHTPPASATKTGRTRKWETSHPGATREPGVPPWPVHRGPGPRSSEMRLAAPDRARAPPQAPCLAASIAMAGCLFLYAYALLCGSTKTPPPGRLPSSSQQTSFAPRRARRQGWPAAVMPFFLQWNTIRAAPCVRLNTRGLIVQPRGKRPFWVLWRPTLLVACRHSHSHSQALAWPLHRTTQKGARENDKMTK